MNPISMVAGLDEEIMKGTTRAASGAVDQAWAFVLMEIAPEAVPERLDRASARFPA
jgi:hypothetical protein